MKKIILILLASLLGYVLLYLSLSFVISNLSKWEVKGFLIRTKTKENIPMDIWKMQISESVQYTPANNYNHLSEEDNPYYHYAYEHDGAGRIIKKKCYAIGKNNTIVTADEYLKNYTAYEYENDRPVREVCYSSMGTDGKWFTPDDIEIYRSVYGYGSDGKRIRSVKYGREGSILQYTTFENNSRGLVSKDIVYKGKGPDDRWFTIDDEIEKYHRFEYNNGKLARIAEYNQQHNGRGPDNLWFSADDKIFATKEFSYCEDGHMAKIKKCIGPGPDNAWFTEDDVVQYYTVYDYNNHVNHKVK
ncbi:MAG: hypothetical protein V2A59_01645 [Candidatus Omnitrophota bacterium]